MFGIAFGFLLQKGGVAKYHILIGVLLLEDFTVIKVMLAAIIVGMLGIFSMHRLGMVELHLKPTRYAANVLGGLLFGVGFALIGYCPGTGAAALGQGNYDALGGVLGLMAGSYLYAEASAATFALGREMGRPREADSAGISWSADDSLRACVCAAARLGTICNRAIQQRKITHYVDGVARTMKRRAFIGGVLSAVAVFMAAIRRTPLVFASPAIRKRADQERHDDTSSYERPSRSPDRMASL